MKKRLAQDISKYNKEINAEINKTTTNASDVGNKLLKDDDLTLENINELGQNIAEHQGYDKNQLIVCDVKELNTRLESLKETNINETPIFLICSNEENTKAAFCIVKLFNKTVCLYKDFLNIQIPENIKNILEHYFGENIEFKIHAQLEKTDQKNQDVLCLKTLETMMVYLYPDKRRDFIDGFANPKKTFFNWIKNGVVNLKGELFSLVKEGFYKAVASDIEQLSRDTEFKEAIKNLINSIPLIEEVDNFKIYQTLLKEFAETEDNEIDSIDNAKIKKLEEARENAFSKTRELKIASFQNKNGTQLDIVEKFPTQMEKFTRIFEPLTRSSVDEKLDEILKEISLKLDLEHNKLKSFFRVKEEEKKNDNYSVSSIRNIQEVICVLPKYKVTHDTDLVSTSKPFEQLLSEIIIEKSNVLNTESLKECHNKVKAFYKLWETKDAVEINRWVVSKKGTLQGSEMYEALAIMDRANELVTGGHRLRDTQILSVLTFLQQEDKGQLSQIQTGEGKTTIVSMLAAIKALQGEAVDVITSNPVLASDGIKDKKNFFMTYWV